MQRTLDNGSVTKAAPATSDKKPSKRCFGCHVNGAPLMNELHEPWSNWVSSRSKASRGALGGETKSIVDQSTPNAAAPGRSGLANELEQIISQGTQRYIVGLEGRLQRVLGRVDRRPGTDEEARRPRREGRSPAREEEVIGALANDPISLGRNSRVISGGHGGPNQQRGVRLVPCKSEKQGPSAPGPVYAHVSRGRMGSACRTTSRHCWVTSMILSAAAVKV